MYPKYPNFKWPISKDQYSIFKGQGMLDLWPIYQYPEFLMDIPISKCERGNIPKSHAGKWISQHPSLRGAISQYPMQKKWPISQYSRLGWQGPNLGYGSLFFPGLLGYYLYEIGILGSLWGIWDHPNDWDIITLGYEDISPLKLGFWDSFPLKLGYLDPPLQWHSYQATWNHWVQVLMVRVGPQKW